MSERTPVDNDAQQVRQTDTRLNTHGLDEYDSVESVNAFPASTDAERDVCRTSREECVEEVGLDVVRRGHAADVVVAFYGTQVGKRRRESGEGVQVCKGAV